MTPGPVDTHPKAPMRVVVAMDSFKGTLSAGEACAAVAAGLLAFDPETQVRRCPMADGGEGTVEVLASVLGGAWVDRRVAGPVPGSQVDAGYLWLEDRRVALVEMARASGLTLLDVAARDPRVATTYGTGELLADAVSRGAVEIWLTIGGSATVDGGVGVAAALGWRFRNAAGRAIVPGGGGLVDIVAIEPPDRPDLPPCRLLCDVTNPLLGPRGAAAVFGPQKGADASVVAALEEGLAHLAARIEEHLGMDVRNIPGGGAAGGLGAGAVAFLGATIESGGALVAEQVGLPGLLDDADWVVTGEGRFDTQSLDGKVVAAVARLAAGRPTKVAVLAGRAELGAADLAAFGIDPVRETATPPLLSDADLRAGAAARLTAAATALAESMATS